MMTMARKFKISRSARAPHSNGILFDRWSSRNAGTLLDILKSFFIILTILLVCLKRKPAQFVVQTSLNGLVIGPELVIIPENHCLLWTATRDFNQRKFNYPTSHRYGLKLNLNCNPSHIFFLILLSGDVATNPGPCCSSRKKKQRLQKQN